MIVMHRGSSFASFGSLEHIQRPFLGSPQSKSRENEPRYSLFDSEERGTHDGIVDEDNDVEFLDVEAQEQADTSKIGSANNVCQHDMCQLEQPKEQQQPVAQNLSQNCQQQVFQVATFERNLSHAVSNSWDKPEEGLHCKDAVWFLDVLEGANKQNLKPEERDILEDSGLRAKAKHRSAVLFCDDEDFLFRCTRLVKFSEENFRSTPCSGDKRVFFLQEATKDVLSAYSRSLNNAPPKSCIFSALLYRVAFHLVRSGVQGVKVEEYVEGVAHKEATLFIQGYHISRSNFTKVVRQILKKQVSLS